MLNRRALLQGLVGAGAVGGVAAGAEIRSSGNRDLITLRYSFHSWKVRYDCSRMIPRPTTGIRGRQFVLISHMTLNDGRFLEISMEFDPRTDWNADSAIVSDIVLGESRISKIGGDSEILWILTRSGFALDRITPTDSQEDWMIRNANCRPRIPKQTINETRRKQGLPAVYWGDSHIVG